MGRLQTARLENLIRRWGSIKGPGSVLSETLGDVFPILDLENLTPENQLTAGWFLFQGGGAVTGLAAKLGAIQLLNPADSEVLLVVDKVVINTLTTRAIQFGTAGPALAALINTSTRDTRTGTTFTGKALIRASQDAAGVLGDVIVICQANIDREIDTPNGVAVLAPGGTLTFVDSAVQVQMRVTFYGRARLAEPSELSF